MIVLQNVLLIVQLVVAGAILLCWFAPLIIWIQDKVAKRKSAKIVAKKVN